MNNKNQGFSLFVGLIAVTLIAIVGVVGFVALKKPVIVTGVPSTYVPASPKTNTELNSLPTTAPEATSAPSVSTSTEVNVIEKELNDTKVNSVDAEFNSMNSSASSL